MTPASALTRLEEPVSDPLPLLFYKAARKNWMLVLAVTGLVLLATALYTASRRRIYEAAGTVQFDPAPIQPLGKDVQSVDLGSGSYWGNKEYYETQYQIIRSMRVAQETVKRLNLHKDGAFLANLPPGEQRSASAAIDDAAEVLRSRVAVQPVKDSRLAVVKVADADPARAQRIAGVLLDVYVDQNLQRGLESANAAVEWLGDQLVKLKAELEQSELSLHEYRKKNNILSVSYDDQSNMLRNELQQVGDVLVKAKTEREAQLARLKALEAISLDNPENIPSSELLESPLLASLRADYVTAYRDHASLIAGGRGPNHPLVAEARSKLDTTKQALLQEVSNIRRAVQYALNAKQNQIAGLTGLFENAKRHALELNLLEIEYNRLQRGKENNEKMYSLVLERTKEGDLTRLMRFNNISVVDRPRLPVTPVSPRIAVNIGAGLLFGLVIGLGAALGRETLDRSIRTPEDIERALGATFLGLIPAASNSSTAYAYYGRRRQRARSPTTPDKVELIVHDKPMSGIAEAARAVRTNIMFMAPDKPYRRLLVTSAAPAEGKTTVACCLATAIAQAGQRVLLVDCDMRRPRVHRVFQLRGERGLTNALLDPGQLESLIVETQVPNLWVLPLGSTPPNPSELLHSESFTRLLNRVTDMFDRVIMDSPPIAPVTDAAIISTQMDATLMVIRAFITKKDVARRSAHTIRSVGGNLIGAVLNDADLQRREYGYYRAYYGERSPYAAEPARAAANESRDPPSLGPSV